MKAFTDINQSKKLAEILSVESADMFWIHIEEKSPKIDFWKVETIQRNFKPYSMNIPCWSLAALLDISPYIEVGRELYGAHHGKWYCRYTTGNYQYKTIADNLVDACYETILKLHEKKLI